MLQYLVLQDKPMQNNFDTEKSVGLSMALKSFKELFFNVMKECKYNSLLERKGLFEREYITWKEDYFVYSL